MKKILATGLLFLISTALSAQSLEVVSITPANGATGVSAETSIVITFNEKVKVEDNDPANIDFIQLLSSAEAELTDAEISPDGKTFTFHVTLEENADYTGVVMGAEGNNGEQMEGIFFFRFTTAPTIGQYTIKGSLSVTDQAAYEENDFVVVTLLKTQPQPGKSLDDEMDLTFVTVVTDFDGKTFEIPFVREGDYYPVGFQPEGRQTVYYFYDTDNDIETPDKITVNSSTTTGNIFSGVTLHQVVYSPLTYEDALALAAGLKSEMDEGSVLFMAETYDDLWHSEDLLLSGISSYWKFYYYNPSADNFYEVQVNPEGAFIDAIKPMGEYGYSLPGAAYLPVPAGTINSDEAVSIAENAGGQSFRQRHEGMLINLHAGLSHEYGMYIQNLQEEVPATWVVRYYVMDSNHEFIDEFKIFIDAETGDVLHKQEKGYTIEGRLIADDISALKDLIGDKQVSVYLAAEPQQFNMNNPWIQDIVKHATVDSETLGYSFHDVDEGTYYPIAMVENDGSLLMPVYFLYDTDNNLTNQESINVNENNAVNKVISNIDLSYWEIQPITFTESLAIADTVLAGNELLWKASSFWSFPEGYFNENVYTNNGSFKSWNQTYYDTDTDEAIDVSSDPFGAIVNRRDGAENQYPPITTSSADEINTLIPNIINSDAASGAIDSELGNYFINTFKNEPGAAFQLALHLNHKNVVQGNYGHLGIAFPDSVTAYWVGVYNVWFGSTNHTLRTFVNAETGEIIATHGFEKPGFTTFTVSGHFSSDNPEALKARLAGESISVFLTRNKPINSFTEEDDADIAYTTTLNNESLEFTFTEVEPGTYYIISVLEGPDDELTFFVYDTDSNFDNEESISVNINTAPDGVYGGIELKEWDLQPFTLAEALEKTAPAAAALSEHTVLVSASAGHSYRAEFSTGLPLIANGKSQSWTAVYRDTLDNKFHIFLSSPLNTEYLTTSTAEEFGIPGSINLEELKPVPGNIKTSVDIASIAEQNGGEDFRNSVAGSDSTEILISTKVMHEFWNFELNPQPSAPVIWEFRYMAENWVRNGDDWEKTAADSLIFKMDAVSGEILQTIKTAAEELSSDLPSETKLMQNYPNPFNPATNIPFTLQKAGHIELIIYNITGQKVATLVNKNYQPGSHIVTWNASQFASGVYLYRFTANGVTQTRKLTLIK